MINDTPRIELVVPRPGLDNQHANRWPLTWTREHPESRFGHGVILDPTGAVFDGVSFVALRKFIGAWIDTDQPKLVSIALGLGDPCDGDGIGMP